MSSGFPSAYDAARWLEELSDTERLALIAGTPSLRIAVTPRVVLVPSPAAGADWSVTVPKNVVWRVQTIVGVFTASAVVANRFILLTLSDGTSQFCRIPPVAQYSANQVGHPSWAVGFGAFFAGNVVTANAQPLPAIPLPGGTVIATATAAIDVGDQWSAVVVYTLELREREPLEVVQALTQWANGELEPFAAVLPPA